MSQIKPKVPAKRASKTQMKKPSASSTMRSQASIKSTATIQSKASEIQEPKEPKQFELPPLSYQKKPKITESEFQKMKKRTQRRHAPPGEDIKQIKQILARLKKTKISVQEFVSLIAPSTADRGEVLRSVMVEDLNAFQKLARKVYETITQDNSDVLLNQQQQITENYEFKKTLLNDKMLRSINEIYMMAPKFDFDKFVRDGDKYLAELFPVPAEIVMEPEEFETMKRQAAYHRLQWLRSEGIRLNEENASLKKRLNQLRRMHKEEQMRMLDVERAAEARAEALEATQLEKTEQLDMLNESLEKSFIDREKSLRIDKDKVLLEPYTKKSLTKKKSKGAIKKRPNWVHEAAREIEENALDRSHVSEAATAAGSTSPFHFSPIKTPPPKSQKREVSPFHYSPPTMSEARALSPPPVVAEPVVPQRSGRRASQGPRDSWGGFF